MSSSSLMLSWYPRRTVLSRAAHRTGPGRSRVDARDGDDHTALGSGRPTASTTPALDAEVVEQYFVAGESVLRAALGEGTVPAVESGGIVLVRVEGDGSERRLMASVAPLRRLRG